MCIIPLSRYVIIHPEEQNSIILFCFIVYILFYFTCMIIFFFFFVKTNSKFCLPGMKLSLKHALGFFKKCDNTCKNCKEIRKRHVLTCAKKNINVYIGTVWKSIPFYDDVWCFFRGWKKIFVLVTKFTFSSSYINISKQK